MTRGAGRCNWTDRMAAFVVFPLSQSVASSPYVAERGTSAFLCLAEETQRLVYFTLLLTISHHRITSFSVIPLSRQESSSPYGVERVTTLFYLLLSSYSTPAISVLRQLPCDKSTSAHCVRRVSFISVSGLQSIHC